MRAVEYCRILEYSIYPSVPYTRAICTLPHALLSCTLRRSIYFSFSFALLLFALPFPSPQHSILVYSHFCASLQSSVTLPYSLFLWKSVFYSMTWCPVHLSIPKAYKVFHTPTLRVHVSVPGPHRSACYVPFGFLSTVEK